jgi:hypothetical protein
MNSVSMVWPATICGLATGAIRRNHRHGRHGRDWPQAELRLPGGAMAKRTRRRPTASAGGTHCELPHSSSAPRMARGWSYRFLGHSVRRPSSWVAATDRVLARKRSISFSYTSAAAKPYSIMSRS